MPLWNLLWRRKGRGRNRWKRVFVWGRGIEWRGRKKPAMLIDAFFGPVFCGGAWYVTSRSRLVINVFQRYHKLWRGTVHAFKDKRLQCLELQESVRCFERCFRRDDKPKAILHNRVDCKLFEADTHFLLCIVYLYCVLRIYMLYWCLYTQFMPIQYKTKLNFCSVSVPFCCFRMSRSNNKGQRLKGPLIKRPWHKV